MVTVITTTCLKVLQWLNLLVNLILKETKQLLLKSMDRFYQQRLLYGSVIINVGILQWKVVKVLLV